MEASFIEVYNESLRDLLGEGRNPREPGKVLDNNAIKHMADGKSTLPVVCNVFLAQACDIKPSAASESLATMLASMGLMALFSPIVPHQDWCALSLQASRCHLGSLRVWFKPPNPASSIPR